VIVCFALSAAVVRGQGRGRAGQHEERSGHEDEAVNRQSPSERRTTFQEFADRYQNAHLHVVSDCLAAILDMDPIYSGDMSQNAPLSVPI
jgi:hypothetical protein